MTYTPPLESHLRDPTLRAPPGTYTDPAHPTSIHPNHKEKKCVTPSESPLQRQPSPRSS